MVPADLKYTKDHEWIQLTGDRGRVGISDYAQKQLGDVVYVQLPDVGATFRQGQVFGSVESVKAVSDLFSPMTGEVVEVNGNLASHSELLNKEPYGAWLIVLKLSDVNEAAGLLSPEQYEALVK
jgi:glycine cleavage system H protein